MSRVRGAVNTLIEGKLYQRGQILTWQRPDKIALLRRHGIDCVVNLWPKVDPDLWGVEPKVYMQLPAEPSSMVMSRYMATIASCTGDMLRSGEVESCLVLCEAGKTRSVVFSAMVAARYLGVEGLMALNLVRDRIGSVSLKPDMLKYLEAMP